MAISTRALTFILGCLLGCAAPSAALAETWPSRAVMLVIPFPAGSATDSVARKLAEGWSAAFNQPFIVENKPGADGIIAARAVARAEGDGYTLFITTNTTHSANPNIYTALPYDPEKDFAPIGGIMKIPMVLAVRANSPANDLASFVKLAQEKQMSFGSGNTSSRGAAELFKARIGATMLHVPYRGTPQAITDLLGGSIDFMFPDPSSAAGPIQGGQLKLLGVASAQRLNQYPNVPTIAESGVPGYQMSTWYGAVIQAKTPREIVVKLNQEMIKALALPDIKERMAGLGADVVGNTPEEAAALIKLEVAKYTKVANAAHISAD